MTRRASRIALVTLGLCTLAACIVNLSFDMTKPITVQTQTGVTVVNQQQPINLADYPDFESHKDSIKSLDLESADVTVTTINTGNSAHSVTGTVTLQQTCGPASASDVPVGSLSNFNIASGSTVRLPGSPALDAFLMAQVQGAGTFCVNIIGNVDAAPVNVTLTVTLHASLGYDTGLFLGAAAEGGLAPTHLLRVAVKTATRSSGQQASKLPRSCAES